MASRTTATIETSMGTMEVELYDDLVPNTVASFVHLASKGFYDGLTFHRVISDFMVQAGCPEGTGRGGPGYRFADEFAPGLRHDGPGVLSMANAGPNTNGSQFFITLVPTPWLDCKHAVFGRLTKGMDVLEAIGSVRTDGADRPVKTVTIESVTLSRDGSLVEGEQPVPDTL